MTVTSIDQARLLADPLKLRIIQEIALTPHTTKQVATILGEKPTGLYRHMEALRAAGLAELVAKKKKRGTVEKYFLAVARRFEIHPDLFAPDGEAGAEVLDEMLSAAYRDLRRALHQSHNDVDPKTGLEACFVRLSVRASEDEIQGLRRRLIDWVEQCQNKTSEETVGSDLDWSGLVAFFPDPK